MTQVSVAQPDITLHLDAAGVIREANLSDTIPESDVDAWLGRPWGETVADVGGDKIKQMISDASSHGVSAFRQINQRFPSGREIPMEFATVRIGDDGGLIAVGRNLQAVAELQTRLVAAQQAMERDYWKFREVETRYRLLFDASNEAVLLIRASNLHIVEANPAAIRALGVTPVGQDILSELAPQERDRFANMVEQVREHGKAPAILLHLGQGREPWMVRASLMTGQPGPVLLVQLTPTDGRQIPVDQEPSLAIETLVERAPDGFVVTDADGKVLWANRAFLDLVQISTPRQVIGERIGRWLERPGADEKVLLSSVRKHGLVRLFSTTLHGELGMRTDVEISAAGSIESDPLYTCLIIRDVSQRLPGPGAGGDLGAALEPLAEQIGKSSLRELVSKAVGTVERHYIESALELTNGNRKAAAELLGLSRQSLYTKLNRYGLDAGVQKDLEWSE